VGWELACEVGWELELVHELGDSKNDEVEAQCADRHEQQEEGEGKEQEADEQEEQEEQEEEDASLAIDCRSPTHPSALLGFEFAFPSNSNEREFELALDAEEASEMCLRAQSSLREACRLSLKAVTALMLPKSRRTCS
jgi:cobalamin biosynthesis protein CobT